MRNFQNWTNKLNRNLDPYIAVVHGLFTKTINRVALPKTDLIAHYLTLVGEKSSTGIISTALYILL